MKVYSHFIQTVFDMSLWPDSQNMSVIPPQVRKIPGRPKKVRRKEQTENKTGKLFRRGLEMTCRSCNEK